VTVIDPDRAWVWGKEDSAGKSRNSPFYGWPLKGKAVATIVGGKKAWLEEPELTAA
jgi:dihydroorotase